MLEVSLFDKILHHDETRHYVTQIYQHISGYIVGIKVILRYRFIAQP